MKTALLDRALPTLRTGRAGSLEAAPASRTATTRATETTETTELTRPLLAMMAIACGLGIANLYYNQPLLGQIARSLHVTDQAVGILPMLTQVGFGVAVFLIAPLGDVMERRRLILTLLGLVSIALLGAALSPTLTFLAIASLAVGVTSVISTLVLPFAVHLSRPEKRGATVGTIAGAMLIGVLLSRTLSGAVGEWFGWRAMYGIAMLLMLSLAGVLYRLLPRSVPTARIGYGALLSSMVRLVKEEPLLRQSTLNGMLLYGALCAFWTSLVFLIESPAYHYGSAVAGIFGLVGAGGALAAPLVGKLTDSRSPRVIVGLATGVMLLSFVVLWSFGLQLWGLIVGIIGLDIAAQAATVSNQATVYSLNPDARSRLYTVYRAFYSLGGSLGAYLSVLAWSRAGWNGVCFVGVGLLSVALVAHSLVHWNRTSVAHAA